MKKLIICILLFSNMVFAEKINELVIKGDLNGVKKILDNNPDKINSIDNSMLPCGTPLHYSAYFNKMKITKFLIFNNANLNKKNSLNYTPILGAMFKGNFGIVKLLTKNGACLGNILSEIKKNTTVDIVKFLVENGADFNYCEGPRTPLKTAIIAKNHEVANYLRSIGAINSDDFLEFLEQGDIKQIKEYLRIAPGLITSSFSSGGKTAIYIASERGYLEIVRNLLNIGVDPNQQTKGLVTPLHLASLIGSQEIVKLLLNSGAKILKDEDRHTPLSFTVQKTREKGLTDLIWSYLPDEVDKSIYLDIAKILISMGANINSRDRYGKTNLYYAILSGDQEIEMVKLLLRKGASRINIDDEGNSALDIAKKRKSLGVIRLLRKYSIKN